MKKELGIFILLIVLCVIVSIVNPNFLLANNLQNLARQIGAFGIFSIGLGSVDDVLLKRIANDTSLTPTPWPQATWDATCTQRIPRTSTWRLPV